MLKTTAVHEGVIRPSLIAELNALRAPDRRASSYYLNLGPAEAAGNREAVRGIVKNFLAEQRERIDQLGVSHEARFALRHDLEQVESLAPTLIGERHTRGLACFVLSEKRYGRTLPLPWPVRNRAFFEDRFVLWPLHLILEQAERYGIILTNKEEARLFLFNMEKIEEIADVVDVIPGRIRFPDPLRQSHYMHKHVEHFHHHFEKAAEAALRLYELEPFEHLIIGGLWETLAQFESHLHRYLCDRIVARWKIDVRTPTPQILERATEQEQKLCASQAMEIWKAIKDQRPQRGAVDLDEVFAALWQRRVQALLIEPDVRAPGFRCTVCGRLNRSSGSCVECGGAVDNVSDVYEEAMHDGVEQSAQVRFWKDPALKQDGSMAALKRY